TMDIVQRIKFDFAYMFKFSPRPGTRGAEIYPRVPDSTVRHRLTELIKFQNQITLESNRAMIGKIFKLLIEAPSRRGHGSMGRTPQGKIVILDEKNSPGKLVSVVVRGLRGWTPIGETIQEIKEVITGGH
ncbi:MAG: tRNA (N6-isopentenyl adenosine(37)-C2)-methylthiotransferase MiaB, partial [bacterium]